MSTENPTDAAERNVRRRLTALRLEVASSIVDDIEAHVLPLLSVLNAAKAVVDAREASKDATWIEVVNGTAQESVTTALAALRKAVEEAEKT